MSQNSFSDWFVNSSLGWIQGIANRIVSLFQRTSSNVSSGNAMLQWFSENWIILLLVLIGIGIVLDWLVWMVRWRPYWLWMGKKRILLDDDIDIDLTDEELLRRYGHRAPSQDDPHFKGSRLGRAPRPYDDEEALHDEYDGPDIEDPYLDEDPLEAYEPYADEDEDDDWQPQPRTRRQVIESDDDYEDDEYLDELYGDDQSDAEEDYEHNEEEEDPDISFLIDDENEVAPAPSGRNAPGKPRQRNWFAGLKRPKVQPADEDEDPFSVDGEAFDDPDDDFFSVVSDISTLPSGGHADADTGDSDTSVYQRNPGPQDDEFSEPLAPEPRDWRTGYSAQLTPVDGESRKARRLRRETRSSGDDDE